jgi:hypothetical protein
MSPIDGGDGGGDGDGGGTGGGLVTGAAQPLASFYSYINSRPGVDWNTCGQAAIASMLDFYGRDLGLQRGPNGHWDAGAAIDKVKGDGYGPDAPFGWGSTPGRIRDALQHYGVPASTGSSGFFFSGWAEQWNRLLAYVYYSAIPIPVLIDTGAVGGPAFGGHWTILWKMQYSTSGMLLYFGSWGSGWMSQPVPVETFLQAWAARHLPNDTLHHAAVYTGTPRIWF